MSRSSVGLITTLLVVSVLAPAAVGGATAQDDPVTVTLAVVDSNGDPVSNADLTVTWAGGDGGPKNVTTVANGKAFVDVPNGSTIEVQITDERYVRNRPLRAANARSQEIEVPVALSGQATITVDDQSGNPVEDAEVRVREGSTIETLTTDASGQVTTGRLEQRPASVAYELVVEKPGYFDLESTLAVTGTVNETVTLTSGTRTVNFRVVDDHFDPARPIGDARVRIPERGSLQTVDTGRTSIPVPVNREYTVQVNKDGYSSAGKRIAVDEDDLDVQVAISRADRLSVSAANDRVVVGESTRITVTDEYGDPVSNAQVSIGGQTAGLTDADGEYAVQIDTAGNVTVDVADAGETASVTVEGIGTSTTPEQSTPTPDPPTPTPDQSTPSPDDPTDRATEDPDDETTTAGGSGPGFGVVAAVAALAGVFVLARRR